MESVLSKSQTVKLLCVVVVVDLNEVKFKRNGGRIRRIWNNLSLKPLKAQSQSKWIGCQESDQSGSTQQVEDFVRNRTSLEVLNKSKILSGLGPVWKYSTSWSFCQESDQSGSTQQAEFLSGIGSVWKYSTSGRFCQESDQSGITLQVDELSGIGPVWDYST